MEKSRKRFKQNGGKLTKQDFIAGLDIGTSKVATVVGARKEDGSIDIIGTGIAPSSGLRKGMIVDLEETITAISESVEQAERVSGIAIDSVYASVGGSHIDSQNSKGVIAVSRADGEICEEDISRVIEAAHAVSMPTNREVIHTIPRIYTVDGQENIKDPIGMTGIRLEVDAHVISVSSPCIKNITKCIYQAGLNINEIIFSGLASSSLLLNKQQKEIGVVLADIGWATTTIAVFEEGDIMHSAVIPIGSMHITNDIAIGLKTSVETAEIIKLRYGAGSVEDIKKDEKIDLAKIDKNENQKIEKSYLAEIVEERLKEIFELIQEELKKIKREGNLPAGIILTGGGSKMPDIDKAAKKYLEIPASIGKIQEEISGLVDRVEDPVYSCSAGLIVWAAKGSVENFSKTSFSAKDLGGKIKDFFKNFSS